MLMGVELFCGANIVLCDRVEDKFNNQLRKQIQDNYYLLDPNE